MPSDGSILVRLKARLTRLLPHAEPFAGSVFRSTTPKYANENDLLTGAGSIRHGGRWNPVGIAAIYGSLTPETAMAETLAHHRYYGFAIEDAMQRTFVALEVRLQSVLDLRRGAIRQGLRVSLARILSVDWRKEVLSGREPVTQTLGKTASEMGLEALIVPSAVDVQGDNLLVFPRNLRTGSVVAVSHSDRLGG